MRLCVFHIQSVNNLKIQRTDAFYNLFITVLVYVTKYGYSHFIYLKFVKVQEAKF